MQETTGTNVASEPLEAKIPLHVKVGIAVVGIVVVLCSVVLVLAVTAAGSKRARQAVPGPYAHLDQTSLGDPAAKVQIVAILPLRTDCHSPSIAYLLAACKEQPERFHVRFVNRRLPHGEKELKQRGLHCASIVCNGSTTFTLPDGRKVKLEGGPGEAFEIADLRAVLQGQADRAYGEGVVALPEIPAAGDSPAPPAKL